MEPHPLFREFIKASLHREKRRSQIPEKERKRKVEA